MSDLHPRSAKPASSPASERWATIKLLLDQTMDLPPLPRSAFLDRQCPPEFRAEVEEMLAAVDASEAFLEDSAIEAPGSGTDTASPESVGGAAIGMQLEAWRLTRLIGRGGMGEVYAAERNDGQYQQEVAIKLLRSDIAVSAERFLIERQIVARLQHPGIARLLGGGMTIDGRPYMVIEMVVGEGLRAHGARPTLTLGSRIGLFMQIADAVAFAHRHLIVHRDLKPANVLVDRDGQIKLLDFGIAKLIAANPSTRVQTQMMLTPDAAAPELLKGGEATAATDVYGLGLILHELLTGQPPHRLDDKPLAIAIREILENELPPPSTLTTVAPPDRLRGDLDAIVAKCLRHEPLQRYATADAVLDDLRRWQAGQPVTARGDSSWYVLSRMVRRHRLAFAVTVAVLLSLTIGSIGIAWQAREARKQRDQALDATAHAKAVNDYLMHMFRVANEETGETVLARTVLEKAASRVREELADDPIAARETLLALGELYFQIGDNPGAEAAFGQLLEMADPNADPNAVATAKQRLAEIGFQPGNPEPARRLLAQAQALWARDIPRFGSALEGSRILEAAFEREAGNAERSVAILERIAKEADRPGADPEHLAVILNELGSSYTDAGRFDLALRTYGQALERFEKAGQGNSSNASIALNNLCGAQHLAGLKAEAEACARRSLGQREELFGPSLNSAAAQLLLGHVLISGGKVEEALQTLQQGLQTSEPFIGSDSGMAHRLKLAITQALAITGKIDEAAALADELSQSIASQSSLGRHFVGLLLIEQARIALLRGQREDAQRLLADAEPLVRQPHGSMRDDLALLDALNAKLLTQQAPTD